MDNVRRLIQDVQIPRFVRAKQNFPRPSILPENISAHVQKLLSQEKFSGLIRPNMRICITAGSRGIANIATITKAIVDYCKNQGARPFLIPAMGSHGGATAEGQREILRSLGITEDTMGCPIEATMETVTIGKTTLGHDVRVDRYAAQADAIIVSCRIKPHTSFRGPYESGIMKMMTIGMGKQEGASVCHEAGMQYMPEYIPMFGRVIRDNTPVIMAVASIDNPYDETAQIDALLPSEFDASEPELLKTAFSLMPRIHFDFCDLLVVDEIGKNISGDGMDPNVSGTFCTPHANGGICAQRVCVLSLTEETHGNGQGIGLASAITRRVYDALDLDKSYPTAITATILSTVYIPPIVDSDKLAMQICLKTCNQIDKENPRIIRIKNTLHLEEIMISEALIKEAKNNEHIELIDKEPFELPFDVQGNLL